MGCRLSVFIALTLWNAVPVARADEEVVPLTLVGAYRLALKRSETIAIHAELIKETEGRFLQALSGALPRASFQWNERRQDGSGGSAFTLKEIPERKFVFTQPLFSGFKEFAAIAGSRAERRQRLAERSRAEQLLLVDVSDAFYLLREQREDLNALETTHAALLERIDELNEREQLGRSRRSEVASAEAQLRSVEADLELVRSQETTSRQLLEFLTGRSPIGSIVDPDSSLPSLESEETYVVKAKIRPDVRAAEEAWRVAEKELTIAQAKFWPTVSLESNYYTKRIGVSSGVDWDVLLKTDVPLFQGGQAVGTAKESASRARQAKLRFEETQRRAELEARDAYVDLQGALARTAALAKAYDATDESYRLQVEDYRLSLVNNLDVLQALQLLQDARRNFIHSQHDTKRLYWRLKASVGETL